MTNNKENYEEMPLSYVLSKYGYEYLQCFYILPVTLIYKLIRKCYLLKKED